MRFEDVRLGQDAYEKPVVVSVEPGRLILQREGVPKRVIGVYILLLLGVGGVLVTDMGVEGTVEAVISWKGAALVIVFLTLIIGTGELCRRRRLHREFTREAYMALSAVELAITMGHEALSEPEDDAENGSSGHAVEHTRWIEHALDLPREEQQAILKAVREAGAKDADDIMRQWEELGIETVRERMKFIIEHAVPMLTRACLLLESDDAAMSLSPRTGRFRSLKDCVFFTFPTEKQSRECAAVFNGREVE